MRRKAFIHVGGHGEPGQDKYEQDGGGLKILVLVYVENVNFKPSGIWFFFLPSSHLLQLESRKAAGCNCVSVVSRLQQSL